MTPEFADTCKVQGFAFWFNMKTRIASTYGIPVTIEMLEKAGVSDRLKKEGFNHDGIQLSFKNHGFS